MQSKKRTDTLQSIWDRIKSSKAAKGALYAFAVLLAVGFYFAGTDRIGCAARAGPAQTASPQETDQQDRLEERLVTVLSKIRGAGRVEVLITYETTGEIVTAMSVKSDEDTRDAVTGKDSSTPATVKSEDGQTPIILVEKEPVIRGVVVVAEGAAQLSVRKDLQNAVRAATGVALSHIEVFEMSADAYNEPQ